MEGHWLNGTKSATDPSFDLGEGGEFHRRRKMEERGTSNEGLRKERLRAVSWSERVSRHTDKHRTRPRLSGSLEEPRGVHDH